MVRIGERKSRVKLRRWKVHGLVGSLLIKKNEVEFGG